MIIETKQVIQTPTLPYEGTLNILCQKAVGGTGSTGHIDASDFLAGIEGDLSLTGQVSGPFNATIVEPGVITNAMVHTSAAIVDTKLATISSAGKVANSATTGVSTNTIDTLVLRDGSGNFAAGTITANLSGNATTATSATTAGSFSGSLSGDITGTQSATVITAGIITNSMINASAGIVDTKLDTISTAGKVSNSATTATDSDTASAIVARDASGIFSTSGISFGTVANKRKMVINDWASDNNQFIGIGDDTLGMTVQLIDTSKMVRFFAGTSSSSSNNIFTIVGDGSFLSAGPGGCDHFFNITSGSNPAYITLGNTTSGSGNIFARSNSAGQFFSDSGAGTTCIKDSVSGNLIYIGTGTSSAMSVGNAGITMKRTMDMGSNNITSTGTMTATTFTGALNGNATTATSAGSFSGSLSGDITGTQSATVITAGIITNSMINASAAIADTKLATISTSGKVSNSATTATDANTASAIVARDASGNFTAGTITAALSGNATTSTTSTNFSGSLSGNVTGTQSATTIASGVITNAMINASAAIADTKLATISTASKVSNSATTATDANTFSAIVARDASGNCTIGKLTLSTGIALPTSGGTPATLDYYETGTFTYTMTGPYNTGVLTTRYTRIGNVVTLILPTFTGTSTSSAPFNVAAGAVPTRFRPIADYDDQVFVVDAGVSQASPGRIIVFASGQISIYKGWQNVNFSNSGTATVATHCATYLIS